MSPTMFQSTISGQFINVHPRLAELLGYSSPDELKAAITDIRELYVDPDHRDQMLSMLDAEGEVRRLLTQLRHRDGSHLPIALYVRKLERDSQPHDIHGAVVDMRPLLAQAANDPYRSFFEQSTIACYRSTADGRFLDANDALARLLGYDSTTALLTDVPDINSIYQDAGRRADVLQSYAETEDGGAIEFALRRADGNTVWVREYGRPVHSHDGELLFFEGTLEDITAQKAAQEALKLSESRYRALVDNSRVGVFVNQDGIYTYVNPAFAEMLGYTQAEMTGRHFRDIYAPEALAEAEARYRQRNAGEATPEFFESVLLHANGRERVAVSITISALLHEGMRVTTGTVTDVREQKRIERQLRHNASHDPLTDLPNRSLFLDRLRRTMNNRGPHDQHYAVLFLDLDGFKIINDSLGHAAGDKVLKIIAKRIKDCLNPWDIVSRHGGDEFTIILDNVESGEAAIAAAQRIEANISMPLRIDDLEVFTHGSIGIVMGSSEYREPEEILRDADTAMYSAKVKAQTRISLFDQAMHAMARNRLILESDLRQALDRNEFELFYQPIRSLLDGRLLGFEALLRWQHPQHGLLLPKDFLEVAEETGLIVALGWRLLDCAVNQLAEWQQLPDRKDIYVSVNLAHRQFHHPQLVDEIRRRIDNSGIRPGSLHLELTESIFMDNPDAAILRLRALKQLGVDIFLDDFGTGYSSFAQLNAYSIDTLKVDKSFVNDDNPRAIHIINGIVQLAKALGINVIAEGIENEKQLRQLQALGITQAQGFMLGEPVRAANAFKPLRPIRSSFMTRLKLLPGKFYTLLSNR